MTAVNKDISLEQGATFRWILRFKDKDDQAINIDGWKFRGSVKRSAKLTEPSLADFNFAITSPATLGEVVVTLTDAQTLALPVSGTKFDSYAKFVYDLSAEDSLAFDRRIYNGQVLVSPTGTNDT